MWINCLTHTVTHTRKCPDGFEEHRRGSFCLLSGIFAPFFCLHDLLITNQLLYRLSYTSAFVQMQMEV